MAVFAATTIVKRLVAAVVPFIAVISTAAQAVNVPSLAPAQEAPLAAQAAVASPEGDPVFRGLFDSWKRKDDGKPAVIAIPSGKPVGDFKFTSGYGLRSDPFRNSAAMHAGIDLAGPIGTPIYATADGVVSFAGWWYGYGNLIEVAHGKAIETRYGHLSKIFVKPNTRVKRGELIGLMGSTGRSTGSHLHYEVRIDGRAVNPVPFIQSADYLVAMQQRAAESEVALGGPEE